MSNRKKGCFPKHGWNYWESANDNATLQVIFENRIIALAMSRFKWIGLPETCDARYLEWRLLFDGCATIAAPKRGSQRGTIVSIGAVPSGEPNIYGNPSSWEAIGENGSSFSCDNTNGAFIFANVQRFPSLLQIRHYAQELEDLYMTKRLNRLHQKKPFVLTGDESQVNAMINIIKQIAGNEGAIIGSSELINLLPAKVDSQVPFIGNELNQDILNTWQEVFTFLGVQNLPFKAERQIEDEVNAYTQPSDLMALSELEPRREAAEHINKIYSAYLDEPIQCVWNEDYISDNYNLMHDLERLAGECDE